MIRENPVHIAKDRITEMDKKNKKNYQLHCTVSLRLGTHWTASMVCQHGL